MATVLMTGGTGLIGGWVRRLWTDSSHTLVEPAAGTDLLAPDTFTATVEQFAPDVVLHLAWSAGSRAGYRGAPDNSRWTEASAEVAALCARAGIRFVATGTVVEDREPGDAYSASKYELRTRLAPSIDSGAVTWLRPYYVFDPNAGRPVVLGAARQAAAEGRPVELRNPNARHDFVHAADVGAAVVHAIGDDMRGVVDIGAGTLHSVAELIAAGGWAWRPAKEPDDSLHDSRIADTAPLLATGWSPSHTDRYFA